MIRFSRWLGGLQFVHERPGSAQRNPDSGMNRHLFRSKAH
jgi:hypothetical protein